MRQLLIVMLIAMIGCQPRESNKNSETDQIHIVFVIGDEEYRSEESMPMLAQIVNRELGAKITLCYSVDSMGIIDPNRLDHIEGLEALETADLMVMFTRFRELPPNELKHIISYAESGRPMVGFRTSTHAFYYGEDSTMSHMNNIWPTKVFGQQWITHHGHFDDGANPLTEVSLIDGKKHPILIGLEAFEAYSWLYHVDGGDWKLYGDSNPLLFGRSLKSRHEMNGNLDKYPLKNPVGWTKSYTGESGKTAKIFFTTLGHPYDWENENMRRLAINGIYWALDQDVPTKVNVDFVDKFEPNNSGFGQKFKPGMRPMVIGD